MTNQTISQDIDPSYFQCILSENHEKKLASNWQVFLAKQTMKLNHLSNNDNCFYLNYSQLTEETPQYSNALLEQMSWVLLARNDCDLVLWPLVTSINSEHPLTLVPVNRQTLEVFAQSGQGYIGMSRSADCKVLKLQPKKILCFSHALISKQNINNLQVSSSLLRKIKNKLSLEQKIFLKHKYDAFRTLLRLPNLNKKNRANCLAYAKSWSAKYPRPQLALNPKVISKKNRIPVLIATHWLELGGAEKFAIDLIKSLPKDQYAIYVTTDIASLNHWSHVIADQVEAIYHLPSFLTPEMFKIFYEYLIRTRHIRLMHIHHAAQAYESLYHIRRFHPQLQILDSLHIIELPPNEGGYVDASARLFEAFINHHHVISQLLKNFLSQRWLVPDSKISVTYLNVDSDFFNPELVQKGQIRQQLNISDNACLVGFIGRFSSQKRPLEFIKTAQLLQQRWQETQQSIELIFVMLGSGLLADEIHNTIEKAAETRILLHPQVQDARPFYQDCDVIVMPAENEGLALVTYESMSMQTPIFYTDVGAQNELLQTDFLIANKQPLAEKFADKVWPYLLDQDKREQAGIKMRDYIRKHHHHNQTTTELLALYQRLLAE